MRIIKSFIAIYSLFFIFEFNSYAQRFASDKDFYRAAEASNYCAIEFYKIIERHNQEANIYFAPYAIYAACSALLEGASDKTYDDFLNVFYFPSDLVKRREIFSNWLKSKEKADVKNSFWLSDKYDYLNAYKIVIEKYYFVDFNGKIDFTNKSVFKKINKQIDVRGRGLPQAGIFDENTQSVLVNVVAFHGKWKDFFDKNSNLIEDFYTSKGNKVDARFLRREGQHLYYENKRIQLLKLEFYNSSISALFILPKQNKIGYARQFLYTNNIKSILNKLSLHKTVVYIPEFNFYGLYNFSNLISAFGVKDQQYAKISQDMTRISNFFHRTFIKVDGELRSSSAKAIDVGSVELKRIERDLPPYVFRAEHPFIFMIIDEDDGKILFLGKVENPSK
jgi:serpin B